MSHDLLINNPKLSSKGSLKGISYPFYPGFSTTFVNSVIESTDLPRCSCIADPWNGSGTTTSSAIRQGFSTYGFDLNPVMVTVAKARLLNKGDKSSLWPLAKAIVDQSKQCASGLDLYSDPLALWLIPKSVCFVRQIERSLQILLVDPHDYQRLNVSQNINDLSHLAAFFYTALFRTLRTVLQPFLTSNPTWVKRPPSRAARLRPRFEAIGRIFESIVKEMKNQIDECLPNSFEKSAVSISVASSDSLPLEDDSVDLVVSSPPYCTRIDYAVATLPELALLGFSYEEDFSALRRKLIGTTTVPVSAEEPSESWGIECTRFLERVFTHPSKASKSYYYKNYLQYFMAINRSLGELSRVLGENGRAVLVVQDSYYKNIHVDLPQIFTEMGKVNGLFLKQRQDFNHTRTMARINPAVRAYRSSFEATESVLIF